jgi:6-pyruvoyltetrahydropterin/6-carboxytetrahydropterin synthase
VCTSARPLVSLPGRGRWPVGDETEWVIDFADIKEAFEPLRQQLDHYFNEIEGLSNPTSETLARWIWWKLKPMVRLMGRVLVFEMCNSGCIYEREDFR